MSTGMNITWKDGLPEPQCAPNPAYPKGKDLDVSNGAAATCTTALPYPAKRCGAYIIICPICGLRAACTTAGRADDPRSIKLACKATPQGRA